MKKKSFFTKRFYTVAELADMFNNVNITFDLCNKAYKKFPDDELVKYNLKHSRDMINELYNLLENNHAFGIVLDYYGGIDRTTGNNKIYFK